jgi:hypothetical protein
MVTLTNLRTEQRDFGPVLVADFIAPDGRPGCVEVTAQMGQDGLQAEADACVRQSRRHGYVAPEEDRFNELG